jgi:hypothetical protein
MKTILKLLSFILGLFIVFLIAIASNSEWQKTYTKYFPNPYRYGDLYLFSNMPGYRVKLKHLQPILPGPIKNTNSTLTIIGDSYLDGLDSSFFYPIKYRFIHWDRMPDTIPALDRTKKNILIIESTERAVRWRFTGNNLLTIGTKSPKAIEKSSVKLLAEDNLQYMFTHLDWELPFKELKTLINLHYFDKFSPLVSKPDGTGRLYLEATINPENQASSFNPVGDPEIERIVENLNKINDELNACGFDEIYISIIPNAATIYKKAEQPYNHLIERIEQHPDAKFGFIDIYQPLKQEKNSVFHFNDSHWNPLGKTLWILKIKRLLDKN